MFQRFRKWTWLALALVLFACGQAPGDTHQPQRETPQLDQRSEQIVFWGIDLDAAWQWLWDFFFPPSRPPKDVSDGVVWEPIKLSDMRAQRDSFRWSQTSALSEVSPRSYNLNGQNVALPPMHYVQIYVRNGDELRELEEMGIHYDLAPLFDGEWPETTTSLTVTFDGDPEDEGGQFAFALIPAPVYNAIRAEALAGEDTYRAMILRPVPAEARAADGTVSWDFMFQNLGEYAPRRGELTDAGEIVPPLEEDVPAASASTGTEQKRIGRRLRRFVRRVADRARDVVDGVRGVIGAVANAVTRETRLHIKTSVNNRTRAPLLRAWDDGAQGFGKPLRLKGVRVNVSGQSRLTLYKAELDANGEAVVSVPRSLRVNICFEADSPTAKFESGILRPILHCWPRHRPEGNSDIINRAVGDSEFYVMAMLIDARDYATKVLGYKPPKAMVQVGGLAQILTAGDAGDAFVPCLAAPVAPVSVVNAYTDALASVGVVGVGDVLEFLFTTDIVFREVARQSRLTTVHEYGHFVFCTLLAKERMQTYNTVWSQVLSLGNLSNDASTPVKALNEGFADWFASQVASGTNYFEADGFVAENNYDSGNGFYGTHLPAQGQGMELNVGGPPCPAGQAFAAPGCHTINPNDASRWNATSRVVGTVATLMHDAIDRADCNGDQTCKDELRTDAASWDTGTTPFAPEPTFRIDHVGDEQVALSPRQLIDAVRDFANANGVFGTALNYDNFYKALSGKLRSRGYTDAQICKLFSLHRADGTCPTAWMPNFPPPTSRVSLSNNPPTGGTIQGVNYGSTRCDAFACQYVEGDSVTLIAQPKSGFVFKNWSGCSNGTNATLRLEHLTGNHICTANYALAGPLLTVNFSTNGGGSVSGGGVSSGSCGTTSCTLAWGSSVTLTASAFSGFRFRAWSGCSTQATNPVLWFPMVFANQNCVANFDPIPPSSFTVNASAGVGGQVTPIVAVVNPGGSVTLNATPNAGYRFGSWSGSPVCTGTNPQLVIAPVNANASCSASFVRVYQVAYSAEGSLTGGSASATVAASGATCSGGACRVDAGSSVNLVATPPFLNYVNHWACTNNRTGQVATNQGASDLTRFSVVNIQDDWTCIARMSAILW